MNGHALVQELLGTVCRCGKKKGSRKTFCHSCYFSLPKPMQTALYRRVGAGYEAAYAQAAARLGFDLSGDGGAAA